MEDAESRKRLDQFVDAAFGFAVTLLLITGAEPPASLAGLKAAILNIPAAAAAFMIIVLFWQSHRMFARLTPARDAATLILSLAIVFTVLVYVYPLRLLMQSLFYWVSGGWLPGEELIDGFADLAALYQIYGLGFALLSALFGALFARSMKLAEAPSSRDDARSWRDAWLICAASGLVSAALALLPLERAPWVPPTTYCLIPIAIWLREHFALKAFRSARAAEAEA